MEKNRGTLFHEQAVALNCGRRALSYLIQIKKIKRLWFPKFICSSVLKPCQKEGVDVCFYPIGADFRPVDAAVPDDDWIYIVNYYGQVTNDEIRKISNMHPKIIVDNAQAYFQSPITGIDTIYTCRKYFGVPDGSFLYTEEDRSRDFQKDESYDHMTFLLGRFERTASEFYNGYSENNRRFNDEPIKRMSKLTANILRGIDYDFVRNRRSENFSYLHDRLKQVNQLRLTVPDGAFMYPLWIENGETVRKSLQADKIYIPTLWPDVFDICLPEELEYRMARDILPLPCDQRYGKEEMQYVAQEILNYIL